MQHGDGHCEQLVAERKRVVGTGALAGFGVMGMEECGCTGRRRVIGDKDSGVRYACNGSCTAGGLLCPRPRAWCRWCLFVVQCARAWSTCCRGGGGRARRGLAKWADAERRESGQVCNARGSPGRRCGCLAAVEGAVGSSADWAANRGRCGAVRCGAVGGRRRRARGFPRRIRQEAAGWRAGWLAGGRAGWQFVVALARRKGESAWLCSGTSAFSSARCELVSAGGCRRAGRLGDRVVGRQS